MKDSEKKAHKKYNREKMKAICFRLHKESDADLIVRYEEIDDKMAFFRWALKNYKKEEK